jgi:hypothetical protein
MDAETQAMDGNVLATQVCDLESVETEACHPWTLDSGIHAQCH